DFSSPCPAQSSTNLGRTQRLQIDIAKPKTVRILGRVVSSLRLCVGFFFLDLSPSALPIRIAQLAFEDLARVLARQLVHEFDDLRHFVLGEVVSQETAYLLR